MISNDFQAYTRVATTLGRDFIHVDSIHNPPHKQVVVKVIEQYEKEIVIHHYTHTTDILVD